MDDQSADVEGADVEKPKLFKRVPTSVQTMDNVPDDFDPVFEAFVHLMKGSLGTGILAMPHGFSFVGVLLGFFGTIFLIVLLAHCVHLILRSQYYQCKRWGTPFIEYPDCMEDAFKNGPKFCQKIAPATPYLVDIVMLIYQLGTCSCYIIFISSNIAQVADRYGIHLHERVWMCIILIPIMLMNLIRDLHYLAPISTAGNFAFVLSMFVIYYYLFGYDGSAFSNASERPLVVWPPTRWPLFIGTACFALESIAIIVKIEHHMREPKKFRQPIGVFNVGIVLTALLFAITGMCGYMKYGTAAQGSMTLNIAEDQIMAQIVKLLYAFVIFFSYPLQNFVPLELLWMNYIKQHMVEYSEKKKLIVERLVPPISPNKILLTSAGAFALVIPHLDLLISLFGAFCLASLGIIFPAAIHILVLRHEKVSFGPLGWILIKDIALIVFGIFIMVSGTVISIMDIFTAIAGD
ncbi:hypothetical protein M8J76_005684 [Diaphorina citri]|nr:hypothetical protein M8J76_005684 [Diaphorina citri]